jgi:hypothetical protein
VRRVFERQCGHTSNRLAYSDFAKLMQVIAPSKQYTQRQLTALFEEVRLSACCLGVDVEM